MTAANTSIRDRLTDFLTRSWTGLENYRDRHIELFLKRVLPVVLGAQRQTVALTDAYLAQLAALSAGGSASPLGLPVVDLTGEALRGVDPAEVYRRPAVQLYTELAAGKPYATAVKSGLNRLLNIALTDLQLAKTHTARASFARDKRVAGHRRILTGNENCGLCRVAATQRYHKERLQPIHPGCDCEVGPIYGDTDPGQVIDQDELDDIHDAVAERFGASASDGRSIDYRKLILVREHGELGPVLTVKGQHFDGPSSIPTTRNGDQHDV